MPVALRVKPWPDPVLDVLGHDPRSWYAETFWLPTLGPTALLLLRHLADRFESNPKGVDLPVAAFAALVAAADVVQEAELRARLERRTGSAEPALTAEALEETAARARTAVDTRWAASLAQLIFPAESLKAISGQHGEGLRALVAAGLASTANAGHAATEAGRALIDPLTRLIGGGSVSTGGLTAAGRVATAHISVFRAADAIILGGWTAGGPGAAVTVARTSSAAALKLLDTVLEHAGEGIEAGGAVS